MPTKIKNKGVIALNMQSLVKRNNTSQYITGGLRR